MHGAVKIWGMIESFLTSRNHVAIRNVIRNCAEYTRITKQIADRGQRPINTEDIEIKKGGIMSEKILVLIGTWLICDGIFSLFTYLGKEGLKENAIRAIRVLAGAAIVWMGFEI